MNINKQIREIESLIDKDNFVDANELLTKTMSKIQNVKYALHAVEHIIHLFEELYPNNERLYQTIETTKQYIKSPSIELENTIRNSNVYEYTINTAYEVADDSTVARIVASACAGCIKCIISSESQCSISSDYIAFVSYIITPKNYNELKIKILKYGIELLCTI